MPGPDQLQKKNLRSINYGFRATTPGGAEGKVKLHEGDNFGFCLTEHKNSIFFIRLYNEYKRDPTEKSNYSSYIYVMF